MLSQYFYVVLACLAAYFVWQWYKGKQATAALIESAEPLRALTPKIPSSADAFSATEVMTARLKAVGLPDEEIAAIRRPILENISKEVKGV